MIDTVSAQTFAERLRAGACTVLDLRTGAERKAESLAGSLHLPVQELERENFEALLSDVPTEQPVYLLCQSGQRAQMACAKLADCDRQLVIIEGGLNALKQQGVAVEAADRQVMSLERQVRIAAGSLVLLGVVLGALVHSGFYGLSGFVGAGLIFAGVTDTCAMGMLIARMPWNRG